jgi:hypothetical protein
MLSSCSQVTNNHLIYSIVSDEPIYVVGAALNQGSPCRRKGKGLPTTGMALNQMHK